MPRGFMDDLEGEVIGEEVYESGLGEDIFSADLYCEDALLPNIGEHRVRSVADDLGGFVGGEGIGKVSESPLHVLPERAPALVRNGNEAFSNVHGIHRAIVVDHHRLLGRLGVEDPHGDLLAPYRPFLSKIDLNVFHSDHVSVCLGRSDLARNDAVLQHPSRLSFADVEHFIELLQGDFSIL